MVSCYWTVLSISGILEFCSGSTGCHRKINDNAFNIATSPFVVFETQGNEKLTLFTDQHGPDRITNITILGASVEPQVEEKYSADPWTLTKFRILGDLTATQNKIMIANFGHHHAHTKPRIGVCVQKNESPNFSFQSYVLLPYSRTVMQIWRNALISPSLPIVVAPLIFSYHNERRLYVNIIETLILCDALFWLGSGLPLLQNTDANINHFLIIITNAIICIALAFATDSWLARPLLKWIVFLCSFSFASFYWTPLALLFFFHM